MSTNIVVALDMRAARKDGTFPLVLRIGHNRRTATLQLGIFCLEKDWNEDKRILRNSYTCGSETAIRLNNKIAKRKARAIELVEKLGTAKRLPAMTASEIKGFIEKYLDQEEIEDPVHEELKPNQSFFAFADKAVADLEKAKRIGSRDAYRDAAKALEQFHGSRELTFAQVNYELLTRFETAHYAKGNTTNGLAAYMRSIRAIFNKAIKAEIADEKLYPFRKYSIKTVRTRKRAISADALDKVIALRLPPDHTLFHARNYFVASYMMWGMNFMDMAFIQPKNLLDGRLEYRRSKTSKLYDIKIPPALQAILDYYRNAAVGSPYVFPILTEEDIEGQIRNVKSKRRNYNKRLKELAELCGIACNLTSYVSRHSFATHLRLHDVPLLGIKEMLGHSSVKTTEIYIQDLPTHMLDEYQDRILQRGRSNGSDGRLAA